MSAGELKGEPATRRGGLRFRSSELARQRDGLREVDRRRRTQGRWRRPRARGGRPGTGRRRRCWSGTARVRSAARACWIGPRGGGGGRSERPRRKGRAGGGQSKASRAGTAKAASGRVSKRSGEVQTVAPRASVASQHKGRRTRHDLEDDASTGRRPRAEERRVSGRRGAAARRGAGGLEAGTHRCPTRPDSSLSSTVDMVKRGI